MFDKWNDICSEHRVLLSTHARELAHDVSELRLVTARSPFQYRECQMILSGVTTLTDLSHVALITLYKSMKDNGNTELVSRLLTELHVYNEVFNGGAYSE